MNINEYATKKLPYHFVLFYNLTFTQIHKYGAREHLRETDNAVLTYCYIDKQAGLSYRLICAARLTKEGRLFCGEQNKESVVIIREGTIVSDAVVIQDDSQFEEYSDIAKEIKDYYGYHTELIEAIEQSRFPNNRHVCYPKDILVGLWSMGVEKEYIWMTEVREEEYPEQIKRMVGTKIMHTLPDRIEELSFAGAGRLLDAPYNSEFGYATGDIVPIYATQTDAGEMPVGIGRKMLMR